MTSGKPLSIRSVRTKEKGGGDMSRLPKLLVKKPAGYPFEEIRDFEQAQYFLFGGGRGSVVLVEGQAVNSYEELVQLAAQDSYKDKEVLEVVLVPPLISGG